MNKKLAAALSGGAVLVLALSGCGDEKNEELDNWAKSLCGQIEPQLEKSVQAQQTIVSTAADGKPADIQKADSQAFQAISDADKAIANALNKAGPPPVDNGEQIQKDAVKDLNEAAKSYDGLKKQIDALDANDDSPEGLKKFSEGLEKVANDLGDIQKQGDQALKSLLEGEVGSAISRQEGCQASTASPTPKAP